MSSSAPAEGGEPKKGFVGDIERLTVVHETKEDAQREPWHFDGKTSEQ